MNPLLKKHNILLNATKSVDRWLDVSADYTCGIYGNKLIAAHLYSR